MVITVLLSATNSVAKIHSESPQNQDELFKAHNNSAQNVSQLHPVFDAYFSIKDALVKTDVAIASSKATELVAAIKAVDMTELSHKTHMVWMKVLEEVTLNSETIAQNKDITKQRGAFESLSNNLHELAAVSKKSTPIYYQHCPMYNSGKGGSWLSRSSDIKNPYYGDKMLACGSVIETLN